MSGLRRDSPRASSPEEAYATITYTTQPSHHLPISVSLSDETTDCQPRCRQFFLISLTQFQFGDRSRKKLPDPNTIPQGLNVIIFTSFNGLPWARGLPDFLRVHDECLPRSEASLGNFKGVPHLVVWGFAYTSSCWCGRSAARLCGPEWYRMPWS